MKKILLLFSIICFSINAYTQEKEIEVPSKILKTYEGKYELGPGTVIDVTTNKHQIFVQLTGQSKFEIFPNSTTEFYLKVVEAKIIFNANEDKKIKSLTLHQNDQVITANKIK